jgi:dUTPase
LRFIPNKKYKETFKLEKGTRIVQICSANLDPLNHKMVESLSETKRGSGGFGSTGK